jgi:hypothetical protein
MILNLLMGQYASVIANRDKTLENQPLKKLHEKVVSDVVSYVISISELCVCMFVCMCVNHVISKCDICPQLPWRLDDEADANFFWFQKLFGKNS